MKNKKIIICIIVVVAAVLSLISVNYAGQKIKSSNNPISTIDESSNTKIEEKQESKEESNKDRTKLQESKDNNKTNDNENKQETSIENKTNDNKKQDNKINSNSSPNIKDQNQNIENNNKSNLDDNSKKENVTQKEDEKQLKKQVVYIEIINGINGQNLGNGQVVLDKNKNLNDIMEDFLVNKGVKYINKNGYISMMYGLSEFAEGPTSGWCYYINGNKGTVGIKGYTPKSGDKIVWKYLNDGFN